MQYLTLLAAFTTLLSLTAGSPIAAGPPPPKSKGISSGYGYIFLHPDTFVLHNNKDNACTLEFENVWGCKDTVVVDSKHTCNTMPKNAHFAGKACGNMNWKVATSPDQTYVTFDDGKGSSVTCNRKTGGNFAC